MTEPQQTVSGTTTHNADRTDPGALRHHEPQLLTFGRILWRRRVLVALGALLPAILVGGAMRLLPAEYTTTFVYERPLSESEYSVLLRRFYSSENLGKIIAALHDRGIDDHAARLDRADTEQALQKLIRFQVAPAYPTRLQTTDPETSERISSFKARLLYIQITGQFKDDMPAISDIITNNVEHVLPIYDVRNDLQESIREFTKRAAEIEDGRFTLAINLQKEQARLEKLSGLAAPAPETSEGNLVLQFTDVAETREFLPLPFQRRAVQSKIIDLQETLSHDEEMHGHYLKLLTLSGRLLDEIEKHLLADYTAQQFLDFLDAQLAACAEEELANYLRSYIRKTQNLTLVSTRAGEQPVVYPVSKQAVKRGVLAFIVFLMMMMFVAVALEHGNSRHGHASARSKG